jgi:acyl-CoA thioester hydrolase
MLPPSRRAQAAAKRGSDEPPKPLSRDRMVKDFDRPYAGGFVAGEHRFAVRVYFEDTDAGGVVYHANYLRFMERARSDMMRAAGIDQRAEMNGGQGVYVISELAIRYLRPARLDDDLLIRSKMLEIRGASCLIQQRVMRGDEEMAVADVTAVLLSPEGRPKRQPRAWVEAFKRYTLGED